MSNRQKKILVLTILLWCFYLFGFQSAVRTFIADLHHLDFLEQDVLKARLSDPYNWTERAYSTYQHLVYIVLSDFWLLALTVLITRNFIRIWKKNDDDGNQLGHVMKNRSMWIALCVVWWCLFLYSCYVSVHAIPTAWRYLNQQIPGMITASPDKRVSEDIATFNKDTADFNKIVHDAGRQDLIFYSAANLGFLAIAILLTKKVLKKNNINNNGNPATQG